MKIIKLAAVIMAAVSLVAAMSACESKENDVPSEAESSSVSSSEALMEESAASENDEQPNIIRYHRSCFFLDGKKYFLPCYLSDFEDNGWELADDKSKQTYETGTLSSNESSDTLMLKKSDGSCKDSYLCVVFKNAELAAEEGESVTHLISDCFITSVGIGICLDENADNAAVVLEDGFGLKQETTIDSLKERYGDPIAEDGGSFTPWWDAEASLRADYVEYGSFYAAISTDPEQYNYSLFSVWSNPV